MLTPSIPLILGPLIISVVLNAFVFGLSIPQFFQYYARGFKDITIVRGLVAWILVLDTVYTACSIWMLWVYLVDHFGLPDVTEIAPWPFPSVPMITAMGSLPIQLFLGWRIKRLTKSFLWFAPIAFFAFTQAVFAFYTTIAALQDSRISQFGKFTWSIDAWSAIAMVTDLLIMTILLKHLGKSRTAFAKTNSLISRIIRTSVETAAVVCFFCAADLITFTALQGSTIHLVFGLPLGRIYTTTLLTTLNSRTSVDSNVKDNIWGSSTPVANPFPDSSGGQHTQTQLQISVHQDIQLDNYSQRRVFGDKYSGNDDVDIETSSNSLSERKIAAPGF